jgi:hypothetical protein
MRLASIDWGRGDRGRGARERRRQRFLRVLAKLLADDEARSRPPITLARCRFLEQPMSAELARSSDKADPAVRFDSWSGPKRARSERLVARAA